MPFIDGSSQDKRESKRLDNRVKACMIEDGTSLICIDPSINVLSILGKKYTMLIIGVIGNKNGKRNFNEILNDIPKSSSTIISKRLKDLMELHIIARDGSSEGIKYELTPLGERVRKSILPLLKMMEQEPLDAFRLPR